MAGIVRNASADVDIVLPRRNRACLPLVEVLFEQRRATGDSYFAELLVNRANAALLQLDLMVCFIVTVNAQRFGGVALWGARAAGHRCDKSRGAGKLVHRQKATGKSLCVLGWLCKLCLSRTRHKLLLVEAVRHEGRSPQRKVIYLLFLLLRCTKVPVA